MREHPRFPLLSISTLGIAMLTILLAGAALLAHRYWLAGWLVLEGSFIWLTLPTYATKSPRGRVLYCLFVVGVLGLGCMGVVDLWRRW